jgi:hypothetical protein
MAEPEIAKVLVTPTVIGVDTKHDDSEDHINYIKGRQTISRKWYSWYADSDTPAERKLLIKMDLLILSYAFLGFWVKYIDQGNLTNAYVSGLKEGTIITISAQTNCRFEFQWK